MRKFLIEGSCDGGLFSETIEAQTHGDAEAFAIERLCEAWGQDFTEDTTLWDLGDAASVSEYSPEDYARDAAPALLAFVSQVARMTTTMEAHGDPECDDLNDLALNGLILMARKLEREALPPSDDATCGQCNGTGRTQSASNGEDEVCPVCDGLGVLGECQTCASAIETRNCPCDECGALDEEA